MSRSNPNEELKNPASRFYEFKGGAGVFAYYDKELKQNVKAPLPFTFLVLDEKITVKGFSDATQSGFWSNEVKNVKDQITVRSKKGIEMTGTWEEIKAKMASDGIEYCQSVYIGIKMDGKKLGLANIQIRGSALNAWIEFKKVIDVMKCAVTVKTVNPAKKGVTKYFEPIFEAIKITPETDAQAIELDKVLQEYLKAYFKRNITAPVELSKTEDKSIEPVKTANTTSKSVQSTETILDATIVEDDGNDLPF